METPSLSVFSSACLEILLSSQMLDYIDYIDYIDNFPNLSTEKFIFQQKESFALPLSANELLPEELFKSILQPFSQGPSIEKSLLFGFEAPFKQGAYSGEAIVNEGFFPTGPGIPTPVNHFEIKPPLALPGIMYQKIKKYLFLFLLNSKWIHKVYKKLKTLSKNESSIFSKNT